MRAGALSRRGTRFGGWRGGDHTAAAFHRGRGVPARAQLGERPSPRRVEPPSCNQSRAAPGRLRRGPGPVKGELRARRSRSRRIRRTPARRPPAEPAPERRFEPIGHPIRPSRRRPPVMDGRALVPRQRQQGGRRVAGSVRLEGGVGQRRRDAGDRGRHPCVVAKPPSQARRSRARARRPWRSPPSSAPASSRPRAPPGPAPRAPRLRPAPASAPASSTRRRARTRHVAGRRDRTPERFLTRAHHKNRITGAR